jgi:hypothetical protein
MPPVMVPAMTGPTPDTPVSVVPETLTAAGELLAGAAQLGIQAAHVLRELGGELGAGQSGGTGRGDLPEDRGGLSCGDLLRVAAGDQIAEHGVQPAGDLIAEPGRVAVPFGPHLQHRRVVLGGHLAAGPGPQRGDRHRQRVVRVVVVRVASLQQPHPGRQLRLDVQDPREPPGQQPGQPGSAFYRPGSLRPRRRPLRQLPGLRSRRTDPDLAQRLLRRVGHHRRVRPPYAGPRRSSPASWHAPSRSFRGWRTWRAGLITDLQALAPLLSHATARPERYGTPAAPSETIRRVSVRSL